MRRSFFFFSVKNLLEYFRFFFCKMRRKDLLQITLNELRLLHQFKIEFRPQLHLPCLNYPRPIKYIVEGFVDI